MVNAEYINLLNKYYTRALMYEFSLNQRDPEFINNLAEVFILILFR